MSVNTGMHMDIFPKEAKVNEIEENEAEDVIDIEATAAEEEFNNLMLSVAVSVSQSQVDDVPVMDLTDIGDNVGGVQQSASRHADIVRPSPNKFNDKTNQRKHNTRIKQPPYQSSIKAVHF